MKNKLKKELRMMIQMKASKLKENSTLIKEKEMILYKQIINHPLFIKSHKVAIYYPIKNELSILNLLNLKNKLFLLPNINDEDELIFNKFSGTHLNGKYNIPISTDKEILKPDLIIIPCLAYYQKYRLGYGKAFYDRYLSVNKIPTIGIALKECELDVDFSEAHDIKLDDIIAV